MDILEPITKMRLSAQDDNYCYSKATSVDVSVKVWPADRRGNKGEKKLIRTPDGRIRYAARLWFFCLTHMGASL